MKLLLIVLSLALTTSLYAQDTKIPELKCGDGVTKCPSHKPEKPGPDIKACKKKCLSIKDPKKQKVCLVKCAPKKPHKKKVSPELSGCEKTDSQTITCADGVYLKSSSVNNSEIIKEVHENQHSEDSDSSEASEQ